MNRSSPPIELSEQQRVRIPLAMLIALLGTCAAGAFAWASITNAVTVMQRELAAHDERIKKLEDNQQEIAAVRTNVDWIKRTMEQPSRR